MLKEVTAYYHVAPEILDLGAVEMMRKHMAVLPSRFVPPTEEQIANYVASFLNGETKEAMLTAIRTTQMAPSNCLVM